MNPSSPPRGFALPTLMVILALANLATLLALRNLWVNEQLLNAHSDRLRSQHKAEAMLPVALADILGSANSSDGTPNLRHTTGNHTQSHAFFPTSMTEYDLLRQRLNTAACSAGICAPIALDANTNKASYWQSITATAMSVNASDTPYGSNSAWYWVEVFPSTTAENSTFVYRITALTYGVTPGSSTVLQAIWVRNHLTATTGQWRSWHVLHD